MSNLISHGDEDREQEHVAVPSELLLQVVLGHGEEVPGHAAQERDGHHEVITVRLDEVVPRYGRRVYVMLSKWTNEILK